MKKLAPIIGVLLILVIAGVGLYKIVRKPTTETAETTAKKKVAEPLNVIAISQRPYFKILPEADGRNVTILFEEVKKEAESVDYELEYQSGSLLQGAFGQIELGSLPASEKILLGSCSAGGACTYHEDVKGGTLLTRYTGPENYALKSDWKYIENTSKETAFASRDSLFQITSKDLATVKYIIIFNAAGYPKEVDGAIVSEIYSLAASSKLTGSAEVSIRTKEEGTFTIMGWDGNAWVPFETTSEGKTATATVDLMELYVVVQSS
jgi:hypothetical protein